ncbi:hypothetical protein PHET_00449 [Paragonimus heterotremus]|uniref:Uncharacterized protein n=1 Tax=Paragonimus heterotremus TaxID=100268 RepID=A0A8J4WM47_9TREM|nr:hypothetical protein PHET_00449 [Paragonimus heterotremus]
MVILMALATPLGKLDSVERLAKFIRTQNMPRPSHSDIAASFLNMKRAVCDVHAALVKLELVFNPGLS